MKIVITGSTGFIGSALCRALEKENTVNEVVGLYSEGTHPDYGKFRFIRCNLDDMADLKIDDADLCIHLAAVTNNSFNTDDDVFRINVRGTENVTEFCCRNNIPKIIFASSVNVYLKNRCAYGNSKAEAEKIIENSGLDYMILRCALVYGKGCRSFDTICRFIEKYGFVPVLGNGRAKEQPVCLPELADALIYYIKTDEKNKTADVFGRTVMEYDAMVKNIADAMGRKCRIIHLPEKLFAPVAALFPSIITKEQISHMCEDLYSENYVPCVEMKNFEENIKYLGN